MTKILIDRVSSVREILGALYKQGLNVNDSKISYNVVIKCVKLRTYDGILDMYQFVYNQSKMGHIYYTFTRNGICKLDYKFFKRYMDFIPNKIWDIKCPQSYNATKAVMTAVCVLIKDYFYQDIKVDYKYNGAYLVVTDSDPDVTIDKSYMYTTTKDIVLNITNKDSICFRYMVKLAKKYGLYYKVDGKCGYLPEKHIEPTDEIIVLQKLFRSDCMDDESVEFMRNCLNDILSNIDHDLSDTCSDNSYYINLRNIIDYSDDYNLSLINLGLKDIELGYLDIDESKIMLLEDLMEVYQEYDVLFEHERLFEDSYDEDENEEE